MKLDKVGWLGHHPIRIGAMMLTYKGSLPIAVESLSRMENQALEKSPESVRGLHDLYRLGCLAWVLESYLFLCTGLLARALAARPHLWMSAVCFARALQKAMSLLQYRWFSSTFNGTRACYGTESSFLCAVGIDYGDDGLSRSLTADEKLFGTGVDAAPAQYTRKSAA